MKTVNLTGYVLDEEGNIYGKSGKLLSQFTKDGRYLFVNLQLLTTCNNSRKSNRILPDEDIKLIKIYVRHKIPSVILSDSTTYLNRQFAI